MTNPSKNETDAAAEAVTAEAVPTWTPPFNVRASYNEAMQRWNVICAETDETLGYKYADGSYEKLDTPVSESIDPAQITFQRCIASL